jgi:hypothetical protein
LQELSIACNALKINLPKVPLEFEDLRKQFAAKSTNSIMQGCVGAMDGLLAFLLDSKNAKQCIMHI